MVTPKDAIVWIEIPVSNLQNAREFYEKVMQTTLMEEKMGDNTTLIFPVKDMATGVSCHLYEGKPAQNNGPTLHFHAPAPLEESLKRLEEAGGKIVYEEVKIPHGRFVYCQDLDGNSIGLFNQG